MNKSIVNLRASKLNVNTPDFKYYQDQLCRCFRRMNWGTQSAIWASKTEWKHHFSPKKKSLVLLSTPIRVQHLPPSAQHPVLLLSSWCQFHQKWMCAFDIQEMSTDYRLKHGHRRAYQGNRCIAIFFCWCCRASATDHRAAVALPQSSFNSSLYRLKSHIGLQVHCIKQSFCKPIVW